MNAYFALLQYTTSLQSKDRVSWWPLSCIEFDLIATNTSCGNKYNFHS